jgi:hypothetical protein
MKEQYPLLEFIAPCHPSDGDSNPRVAVGTYSQVLGFRFGGLLFRAEEEFMRTIAVVPILFAALSLTADGAQAAPWCAQYGGGRGGGTNCGFYSFQQCMATIWGNGGFCTQNQFENPYWTGRDGRRRYRTGD